MALYIDHNLTDAAIAPANSDYIVKSASFSKARNQVGSFSLVMDAATVTMRTEPLQRRIAFRMGIGKAHDTFYGIITTIEYSHDTNELTLSGVEETIQLSRYNTGPPKAGDGVFISADAAMSEAVSNLELNPLLYSLEGTFTGEILLDYNRSTVMEFITDIARYYGAYWYQRGDRAVGVRNQDINSQLRIAISPNSKSGYDTPTAYSETVDTEQFINRIYPTADSGAIVLSMTDKTLPAGFGYGPSGSELRYIEVIDPSRTYISSEHVDYTSIYNKLKTEEIPTDETETEKAAREAAEAAADTTAANRMVDFAIKDLKRRSETVRSISFVLADAAHPFGLGDIITIYTPRTIYHSGKNIKMYVESLKWEFSEAKETVSVTTTERINDELPSFDREIVTMMRDSKRLI